MPSASAAAAPFVAGSTPTRFDLLPCGPSVPLACLASLGGRDEGGKEVASISGDGCAPHASLALFSLVEPVLPAATPEPPATAATPEPPT